MYLGEKKNLNLICINCALALVLTSFPQLANAKDKKVTKPATTKAAKKTTKKNIQAASPVAQEVATNAYGIKAGPPAPVVNGEALSENINKEIIIQESSDELPEEVNVEITADEINYNQEKNYYEALGNSEAFIPSKQATLYADKITFTSETNLLEAWGDVKVIQGGNTIYGTYISFNTTSNEYELTEPKLFVNGLKLKARLAKSRYYDLNKPENKKKKNDVNFFNGVAAFEEPISLFRYGATMGTNYSRDINQYNMHRHVAWQDITDKSNLKYSAKEIFIDNTKKTNNIRIKGARVWITDKLSIPSPVHITATAGDGANTRFKGPIIGTRERIGGFALGPRYFLETDPGIFSIVPLLQIGNGPSFGGGLIGTFNTPGDTTALMAGYGSLHNRFIGSVHQYLGHSFHANALVNQFRRDSIFGLSQVGQLYEIASLFRVKLPTFFEGRGMRVRAAAGWAADNSSLYTNKEAENLRAERPDESLEDHSGFRSEIEASMYTKPIWRMGTEIHNFSLRGRGQGAFRFYDTGDYLAIARFGPALEARLENLAFEIDYLFASVQGQSPFLFDQFIDGSQSVIVDGDYRVNKWFSVGTLLTYNIDRERLVRSEFRTEFGPDDFKLRLSYDSVRNQIDLGFNLIFGDPISYETLRVRM